VKQVNKRCEVFVDGGITKGTDILKAVALGAKMVKLMMQLGTFFGKEKVTLKKYISGICGPPHPMGTCAQRERWCQRSLEIIKKGIRLGNGSLR